MGKMRFVPQSFIHCESDGDRLLLFIYIKFFFIQKMGDMYNQNMDKHMKVKKYKLTFIPFSMKLLMNIKIPNMENLFLCDTQFI